MNIRFEGTVLSLLIAAAFTTQQPGQLVERAVAATGGADALRAVRSTTVDYYSTVWAIGQSEPPNRRPARPS